MGHCAVVVARGKGRSPSREVVGGNTIALIEGFLRGIWDLMTESAKGRPSGGTNSRLPRGGRLLGPLLGLVFLIYPVRAVLTSDATPARVAFALGGAALFAGVFLWLMWERTPPRVTGRFDVRGRRVMVAFLVVLAISLNLILGSEWLVLFFHVNIAAGMLLLAGEAYVAIAGLAAVTFALGFASGMAWLALPTAALGLWATAFVRQLAAVAELRSAREELARLAVNEERLRFARDLHDLLGHSLSLITLKSELAGRLLPDEPEKAEAEVRDIEGVARQALGEVREAVAGYRSPTLDEELAGAAEMLAAAGISCRIENGAGLLPKEIDGVLAWAVREGTTNVIRHSQAHNCRIVLAREVDRVHAEITDDGRGKAHGETPGSGLSGLAERVADFGEGEFEAGPQQEGGFRLRVDLPISREATS
jgi:two-component system sensor histidine kinase DesK